MGTAAAAKVHSAIVVGSGFAGLCMGAKLREAGIHDLVILERSHRVGGVWRDNTYPGVACDVESQLYSFSFAPNPNWTRAFAPQREILAYLEGFADDYLLRPHIQLENGVTGARYLEDAGQWEVTTAKGDALRAKVLVSGSGHALTQPVYPDIPGLENFAGKKFHSARWDHETPLDGKRVGVIGTGASAVQIIPSIASKVAQLTVFQRTPAWVLPKIDRDITAAEREAFKRHPLLQQLARGRIYWRNEFFGMGFHAAPTMNKFAGRLAAMYLKRSVPDGALRAKLQPHFTLGCKRVLLSNEYYPALCRTNVEVVTEGVASARADALITRDGREHPLDAIVFATGFEAAEAHAPFELLGRGGLSLDNAWRDGLSAYLGTAIPGFPNLFMILGPNTGLGHTSMIFMIESQVAYIVDAIRTMKRQGLGTVEVRAEASERYNTEIQSRLARSVWNTGGCVSWYLTRAGRNTTAWPGSTYEFRLRTKRFDAEQYAVTAEDCVRGVERNANGRVEVAAAV